MTHWSSTTYEPCRQVTHGSMGNRCVHGRLMGDTCGPTLEAPWVTHYEGERDPPPAHYGRKSTHVCVDLEQCSTPVK